MTIPVFEKSTEIHPRAASSVRTLRLLRAACIAVLLGATSPVPAQQPTPSREAPAAPAQAAAVTPAVAPAIAPAAAAAQPGAAPAERCSGCHAQLTQRAVVHGPLKNGDCQACHRAAAGEQGKCRSRTAAHWTLLRTEPELCYDCHARKDQSKSVHTAVRQGSCLSCHAAHSSSYKGLLNEPPEKICFNCHEVGAAPHEAREARAGRRGPLPRLPQPARRQPPERHQGRERERLLPQVPRLQGADQAG